MFYFYFHIKPLILCSDEQVDLQQLDHILVQRAASMSLTELMFASIANQHRMFDLFTSTSDLTGTELNGAAMNVRLHEAQR